MHSVKQVMLAFLFVGVACVGAERKGPRAVGHDSVYPAVVKYKEDLSSILWATSVDIGNAGVFNAAVTINENQTLAAGHGSDDDGFMVPFVIIDKDGNIRDQRVFRPSDFFSKAWDAAVFSMEDFDGKSTLAAGVIACEGGLLPIIVRVTNDLTQFVVVHLIDLPLSQDKRGPVRMKRDEKGYYWIQSNLLGGGTAITRLTPRGEFDRNFADNPIATLYLPSLPKMFIPNDFALNCNGDTLYSVGKYGDPDEVEQPVVVAVTVPPTSPSLSSDPLARAIQQKYYGL